MLCMQAQGCITYLFLTCIFLQLLMSVFKCLDSFITVTTICNNEYNVTSYIQTSIP
jgi:hypothetical protein